MSTVDTRIGTTLAGYRIEQLLGRGGMSSVYLAEHLRLHRKVALKLMAPELAHDERFRERFLRESELAASLDHPNVVPIYDADEADGVLYIAMRWVEGTDLRELLRRYSPLDPRRAVAIIGQAAVGLDAAHRRGLVHRDVKPGNILIGEDDHVYVSDFGLTKQASSQSGLTQTGQLVGTVDYVAPEQIQGQAVDGRTDIYSLTCVLYEALTGAKPFEKDTEVATIWAHIQDPPPPSSNRVQTLGAGSTPAGIAPGPTTWVSGDGGGLLTPIGPDAYAGPVRIGPPSTARPRRTDLQATTQGGGSIWVLDDGKTNSLVRVTGTRRITRAGPFTGATDLIYAANAVWVVDNSVGQVAKIDPRTMVVITRIDVPDGPLRIAAGGGALWVVSPQDPGPGRVWRIDPVTNVATASTVVGHDSTGVAFGDGSVWVVHTKAGTVQRFDGRTLRSLRTITVGNHPTAIAFAEGRVYVSVDNADPFSEFEGGGPAVGG